MCVVFGLALATVAIVRGLYSIVVYMYSYTIAMYGGVCVYDEIASCVLVQCNLYEIEYVLAA